MIFILTGPISIRPRNVFFPKVCVIHNSRKNLILIKYGRERTVVPFDRELNSESNDAIYIDGPYSNRTKTNFFFQNVCIYTCDAQFLKKLQSYEIWPRENECTIR